MSLTIFPQAFSVSFSPQFNSTPSKPQGSADPPQVSPFGNVDGDYTELSTVKIISDDNDVSTENQQFNDPDHKTRVRIDPETQKVIIEVVDNKTGKEVRQIPGEQQLRLNEGITEYNEIAFSRESDVEVEGDHSDLQEQNRSE
ncbi:MAG: flagellar protein FlaG [Nitrospinota bacterium]